MLVTAATWQQVAAASRLHAKRPYQPKALPDTNQPAHTQQDPYLSAAAVPRNAAGRQVGAEGAALAVLCR